MAADGRHSTQTANHILENWTYANAAARTGATGFTSADLGKVAYQTDTGAYYRLTATTPTWVAVAGSGAQAMPQLFWTAPQGYPPAASYATFDTRNSIPVLDFDAAVDESVIFAGRLPSTYAGGGITVDIYWMATSATSGTCRWLAAWEREDLATDHDANAFAAVQGTGGAAPGTSGFAQKTSIAFTNGAQMDSTAAGEPFRLLVTRDGDGSTGTDDMAGDAELMYVAVRET